MSQGDAFALAGLDQGQEPTRTPAIERAMLIALRKRRVGR
jgi:hypothetical protein